MMDAICKPDVWMAHKSVTAEFLGMLKRKIFSEGSVNLELDFTIVI